MRLADWPVRLAACIEAARFVPFAWGVHDCCTFADDAVIAVTGQSRMAGLRGKYSTARGAAGVMRRHGGLDGAVTRMLGDPVPRARRGDVVLFESLLGPALGVCVGPQIAARGPDGLVLLDMSAAQMAWRVE